MKTFFGTAEGKEIFLYTLENERIIMKVSEFGAALVALIDKETGIDIAAGFDSAEAYAADDAYIGMSVGRTANRIEKGIFELNGKTYHLPVNNNGNCNHGGIKGLSYRKYDGEEKENSVTFTYFSPDGEEGYPGNLKVSVTYTLLENGIEITAGAKSDRDTLFGYTNHAYFNLDGSDSVLDHQLYIPAGEYAPLDETGMCLEKTLKTAGTPFDFTSFHAIGERIEEEDEQLKLGAGYDHAFVIPGEGMRLMAQCRGEKLQLTVMSDLPALQLYTSNWFHEQKGKYGKIYHRRAAVALEAAYRPNAVNYPSVEPKPILKKDEYRECHIPFLIDHI